MQLFIKNMVCNRCILVVNQVLAQAGITATQVSLGIVDVDTAPTEEQLNALKAQLSAIGFEILDDKKKRLIEKIRSTIIQCIQQGEPDSHLTFSDMLSTRLHKDYSYLSKLFSEVEGITIEKYIILQKIEKVKELLAYDEKNLSEIAYFMGYSSVAHLSAQFKKVTGFTPSAFKKLNDHHRKPLDSV